MSRLTEDNAYRQVLDCIRVEDKPLNLVEICKKTKINKGSLHRWLVKWKKEKMVGCDLRPKSQGLGVEEVYYPPETVLIEKRIEGFLIKYNALTEGRTFAWSQFENIAYQLGIDRRSPNFKEAVTNIVKRHRLKWFPYHEQPE